MSLSITRSDESRHDFAFIAGVIIGAISGALVTLALTPMSGADTREKLRGRAGELGPIRDRALEVAAPVKEKAGSIASTATEKGKTLAASGREKAADLAAKSPIGRGSRDESGMDADEANALLFQSDPGAHPGGTVTPSALADAGADAATDATASARPGMTGTAEGPRNSTTETGNGRVSEEPNSHQ